MKQKQIVAFLVLLFSVICLISCGIRGIQSAKMRGSSQEVRVAEESARKDADTLLRSVLTQNDQGFSILYGKSYNQWTKEMIFPSQIEAAIKDNGWTPASKYTYQYAKGFEKLTPSEVLGRFLETRRDNLKDIKEYELTKVEVLDDKATITFISHQINNTAIANAINSIYLVLADGHIDVFAALNKANETDSEFKKLHMLASDFLYYANFSDLLSDDKEIPSYVSETPLTEGSYEISFDLEKNSQGHWLISDKNYKNLVSDLLNYDEKASQVSYADTTAKTSSSREDK
ncbi:MULTISPECIES: hypothetical protein [unclassified Streptococcus]|uniref:hypothetical protein n=1 Tax=unclassified Streptococcus TaxID=2608887 RepID=UPI001072B98B|nr:MULTISPECIES: hypothetical protein [unclassified Streptococcus]MBF0787983.1 hypothetical protein [Streptococcus sp. 19428wC2_LYSM12]MCQ9211957.1 hypothetical protein [Streptococcus sp. B01]MCQ9213286.1 hypothetical protein [Streptococcus sp. O1]TFV04969.1 hypothetical protein E4T79_08865 [Streptococcus sp. LYSM12]